MGNFNCRFKMYKFGFSDESVSCKVPTLELGV